MRNAQTLQSQSINNPQDPETGIFGNVSLKNKHQGEECVIFNRANKKVACFVAGNYRDDEVRLGDRKVDIRLTGKGNSKLPWRRAGLLKSSR